MIGLRFNRLTVTGEAPYKVFPSGRKIQVTAICECGKEGVYVLAALKSGKTKSCGCYNKDRMTTHGMHNTRQYQTWADMKTRCDNIKHKWYSEYGGRGISYDEKWSSFEAFWEDMEDGYSDELTLDRIDNNGHYCKENCRWVTSDYQSHNQRKSKNAKNKYLGVTIYDNGKAFARIKMKGRNLTLGTFSTGEVAAKAYDDASYILYEDRPNGTEAKEDDVLNHIIERVNGAIEGKSFRPRGSNVHNSVLTEGQVLEICKLVHEGTLTQIEIADKFGLNQSQVSAIKRGTSWGETTKEFRNSLDNP